MSDRERQITLYLDRIDDLFVAPRVDVARDRLDTQPGMDELMNELRAHRPPAHVTATIVLPDADAREGAGDRTVLDLIRQYCQAKIHRNENDIVALRRQGWRELIPAIVLLFGCLTASVFISKMGTPNELNNLLTNGLSIVGWVGMWQPLQSLLYDWYPAYSDNKIYARIMDMDVRLRVEA